jgi:hypothetical protein
MTTIKDKFGDLELGVYRHSTGEFAVTIEFPGGSNETISGDGVLKLINALIGEYRNLRDKQELKR